VLLALIGIYGVMSYAVTQRTHEIGVRMALGARGPEIVRMVVRQGMAVALTGIAAGTVAALGVTRWMATLLFDVKLNDPWIFAGVAVALAGAALAASWVPSLRSARRSAAGASPRVDWWFRRGELALIPLRRLGRTLSDE